MSKKNHINAKDMAVLSAAMHKEANGTSTDADKTVDAIINDLAINFKGRPKKAKASINKRYHGNRSWVKSQEADARKQKLQEEREIERRNLLDPVAMAESIGRQPEDILPSRRHFS